MPSACSKTDCDNPAIAKGLCAAHYVRRRTSDGSRGTCSAPDCDRPAATKGLCTMHYQRLRKTGTLATPLVSLDPVERFWASVEQTETCWLWTGSLRVNGYGQIQVDGRNVLAHRFSYELLVGPIPDGLTIDHLCCNRACVNPSHMEPVTNVENVMRGESQAARNARSDRCSRGHRFDEENTYWRPDGRRSCRKCKARSARKRQNT